MSVVRVGLTRLCRQKTRGERHSTKSVYCVWGIAMLYCTKVYQFTYTVKGTTQNTIPQFTLQFRTWIEDMTWKRTVNVSWPILGIIRSCGKRLQFGWFIIMVLPWLRSSTSSHFRERNGSRSTHQSNSNAIILKETKMVMELNRRSVYKSDIPSWSFFLIWIDNDEIC